MATIRKRGGRWQAQVRKAGGLPQTMSFPTKAAAERWARRVEVEIDDGRSRGGRAATGKVGELIARYEREVDPIKRFSRSKASSLGILKRGLGAVRLRDLDAEHVIRFAKMRKREGAGPVTVGVDLSYLGTVLRTARGLWRLGVRDEMVREARVALGLVGLVGHSRKRRRRPTAEELEALTALWRANGRQGIPMVDLVEFAIASAMRLGEICRLRWEDLDEEARTIVIRDRKHPQEKRGNDQEVALLDVTGFDALGVIRRQGGPRATREGDRQPPRAPGLIFPYKAASVGTAFARACRKLGIEDLTFHDLRHEGVSRLFEAGLRLEQVALISGHRDWSMLRRYTQLRSRDLTAAYAPRVL